MMCRLGRGSAHVALVLLGCAVLSICLLAGCQRSSTEAASKVSASAWYEASSLTRDALAAAAAATPMLSPQANALAAVRTTERDITANWWSRTNASEPVSTSVGPVERLWNFRYPSGGAGIRGLAHPTERYIFAVLDARHRLVYETVAHNPPDESDEWWGTRILDARSSALVLLWRHLGRTGFSYAVTDDESGAGSWVLAEAGGRVVGVYLGDTGTIESTGDSDVSSRIRAGRIYADAELVKVLTAELKRTYGGSK